MSLSPSAVYLVTGANRGIGLGLVEHILEKHPDAFVYAGARDPTKAFVLRELGSKYSGRVAVVKCVSGDIESNAEIAKAISARHGRVDTVIANAGFANMEHTALTTPAELYKEHFTVNALGPIVLFQAVHDLLKASSAPRFVPISTGSASIGGPFINYPTRSAAYGSSKAALNYVTRKIHFENDWLIAFPLAPGVVDTDAMKETVAKDASGTFKVLLETFTPLTPQQSAIPLIKIIDEATREKDGGEFINVDGTKLPW